MPKSKAKTKKGQRQDIRLAVISENADRVKLALFSLIQLYVCIKGTGHSAKEALKNFHNAEKTIAQMLRELGAPSIKELRLYYRENLK